MLKVGDEVYIVPEDNRNKPYYVKVKSIGSKYIITHENSSCNRYDKITRETVCDRTGWNARQKLYVSKEAYVQEKIEEQEYAKLHSKISNLIQKASLEKLRNVLKILES